MIDLEEARIFAERNWYGVAEGELTNREIHDLTIQIKNLVSTAMIKHMKEINLPNKAQFTKRARQIVNECCMYHYGSEG